MPIGVIVNVLAVVIGGTCIGLAIHLGDRITAGAMHMQRLIMPVSYAWVTYILPLVAG